MKKLFFILALILVSANVSAQIYKWTDAHGNVHYTDTPTKNSQPVTLKNPQTFDDPSDMTTPVVTKPQPKPAVTYQELSFTPANDFVLQEGLAGNLTISITIKPQLHKTDKVQVYADGKTVGKPQYATGFKLTNLSRGEHKIKIAIVDEHGNVVIESDTHKIFVRRPFIKQYH